MQLNAFGGVYSLTQQQATMLGLQQQQAMAQQGQFMLPADQYLMLQAREQAMLQQQLELQQSYAQLQPVQFYPGFQIQQQQAPSQTSSAAKKRLQWTPELRASFLRAVKLMGFDAAPSKLLEVMNEPTVTRDNVASYLQQYRYGVPGFLVSTPPPSCVCAAVYPTSHLPCGRVHL